MPATEYTEEAWDSVTNVNVKGASFMAQACGKLMMERCSQFRPMLGGQWILHRTPLGRWGDPEDVTGAVVFLASRASDFVTGQVLFVDGGVTAGSDWRSGT